MWDFTFFANSILLGVGLAMDAFSVSLANGLNDPCMKNRKITLISGTFVFFQLLMPLTGWFLVHSFLGWFTAFEKFIPYIALALLAFIGGKMIKEGLSGEEDDAVCRSLSFGLLIVQGIATSIDALSVGFTIASYGVVEAFVSSFIIGAVTFFICFSGVVIGKKFGNHLAGKASIFGGVILIVIGLEIFITGII
jgi:putative Mn2+ efflux pump MntP